ncbi:uncharacterized protein LOC144378529 [Ictidomys tridecemlineatus]
MGDLRGQRGEPWASLASPAPAMGPAPCAEGKGTASLPSECPKVAQSPGPLRSKRQAASSVGLLPDSVRPSGAPWGRGWEASGPGLQFGGHQRGSCQAGGHRAGSRVSQRVLKPWGGCRGDSSPTGCPLVPLLLPWATSEPGAGAQALSLCRGLASGALLGYFGGRLRSDNGSAAICSPVTAAPSAQSWAPAVGQVHPGARAGPGTRQSSCHLPRAYHRTLCVGVDGAGDGVEGQALLNVGPCPQAQVRKLILQENQHLRGQRGGEGGSGTGLAATFSAPRPRVEAQNKEERDSHAGGQRQRFADPGPSHPHGRFWLLSWPRQELGGL